MKILTDILPKSPNHTRSFARSLCADAKVFSSQHKQLLFKHPVPEIVCIRFAKNEPLILEQFLVPDQFREGDTIRFLPEKIFLFFGTRRQKNFPNLLFGGRAVE